MTTKIEQFITSGKMPAIPEHLQLANTTCGWMALEMTERQRQAAVVFAASPDRFKRLSPIDWLMLELFTGYDLLPADIATVVGEPAAYTRSRLMEALTMAAQEVAHG